MCIGLIFFKGLNIWKNCLPCLSYWVNNLLNNYSLIINLAWNKSNNIYYYWFLCRCIDLKNDRSFFWSFCFNLNFILLDEICNSLFNFNYLSDLIFNNTVGFIKYLNCFHYLLLFLSNNLLIDNLFWLNWNYRFRKLLNIYNYYWLWFFGFINKSSFFHFVCLVNGKNCELLLLNNSWNCFDLLKFYWNNFHDFSNCRSNNWNNFLDLLNFIWCDNFCSLCG